MIHAFVSRYVLFLFIYLFLQYIVSLHLNTTVTEVTGQQGTCDVMSLITQVSSPPRPFPPSFATLTMDRVMQQARLVIDRRKGVPMATKNAHQHMADASTMSAT